MFLASVAILSSLSQAEWPKTKAESSGFLETSTYADVIGFIEELQSVSTCVQVETMGFSAEGRAMPLVIASRPPVTSAVEARRAGKAVIYIQANIHAGEVEGKEAALHLLRRYCQEKKGVLDKAVLLVAPIYNADGNEKFGPQSRNRPGQGGPEMVGQRANGQGLDLNRDYIKAETPEFLGALAHVYRRWDPELMMDLHTTDGTRHGYALTYAPPLNPGTPDEIEHYARDVMMPAIRKQMRQRYGIETFDYGNTENRDGKTAWYEVGPEGRYSTNYAGLRNRFGILSEALTYLPFKRRIEVTEKFTDLVINWTVKNSAEIVGRCRKADATVVAWGLDPATAPQLGLRFEPGLRGVETLLIEKSSAKKEGPPKDLERVTMPVFDRFVPTLTSAFPFAYILPGNNVKLSNLLVNHGVRVERLKQDAVVSAFMFSTSKVTRASQEFQRHKFVTLEGSFVERDITVTKGMMIVRTAQPLGVLAFHILEPLGTDGAVAWNFLDPDSEVPYLAKLMKRVPLVTEGVGLLPAISRD